MSIQSVTSSIISSPSSGWKYDVFLSFRGEDTRKSFTDHLYAALNQKGIYVFKDDNELKRGQCIQSEVFKAIEESRFSIIVFSKNYAYSTWCLDELVKIVECKNASFQQMVFPIFYDVEPNEVRKQKGNFQEAFANHEEAFKENLGKVQKWIDALKVVANISGWELKDRNEAEFIENITKDISSKLLFKAFEIHKELVGINSRLKELMFLLEREFDDVRMIGIWGMGGVGKTTIARVVYDLMCWQFEGSCFVADVREISDKSGLITLQKQLLFELLNQKDSNIWNVYEGINVIGSRLQKKKVLLVIDDVVDVEQLEGLAAKHQWFGSGSRIIITSRDKHVLITHGVDEMYMLKGLNDDEALQLFCMKAFKSHQPMKGYKKLSKRVLKYANGLPLALKILGSFLHDRNEKQWESALQGIKRDPTNKIMKILQISFDVLQEIEKKIFLDIACFLKGKSRDYITKIMEGCDFDPVIRISVLIDKSLISILDDDRVWMHDLLEEMGQHIVKRESKESGKHSRLWEETDVRHVLSKNKGTKVIEGIMLNYSEYKVHSIANAKAFSKMTNLRLLKIHNVELPEGLECLSNELRLLDWHGYPLESLPSNLQLDKTVELNLCYSNIKQMLNTIKPLYNLKFIRCSHSRNFIKTPDFTVVPNLEELILEGCTRLNEIHASLFVHKKLSLLSLKGCTTLTNLPGKIAMESLRSLVLSGCSNVRKFPEIVGSMKCLSELCLDGTAIKELPLSVGLLSALVLLNLEDCKNLKSLPTAITKGLKRLKYLNLSGCSKLENVPENLGEVESLEELDISGTAIRQPVSSIFLSKNLKALSFRGCKGPPAPTSWFSRFPFNFITRRSLKPIGLMLPSLSGLSSLIKLDLSDCNLGEGAILNDICNLLLLEELNLSKNNFVSLPGAINRLSKLKGLELKDCMKLQSLPELPCSIQYIRADGCASLETLSDALNLCFKQCQNKYLIIRSANCLKLSNKDWVFTTLKGFLETEPKTITCFCVVAPASQIPEWFRYKNEGSSITITRPPNSYYNKNKLVGYAICCIFHVRKTPLHYHLSCNMEADEKKFPGYTIVEELDQAISDHLWLLYLSNKDLCDIGWKFESNHIELSFEPFFNSGPGLEVKRSGVHPVYVDEVAEFSKTTKKWTKSKVWNINEYDQVFVVESRMEEGTMSKRSLTEYVGVEASDEEPQAKRFREIEYEAKSTCSLGISEKSRTT